MMVDEQPMMLISEIPVTWNYPHFVEQQAAGCVYITSQDVIAYEQPYCILRPKNLNVGIGCRRGKTREDILAAIRQVFQQHNLSLKSIKSLASIDIKRDEQGLLEAAETLQCLLQFYSNDEIQQVQERFTASEFVQTAVGVSGVCEPCACLSGGKLIVKKTIIDGITIAVARAQPSMAKLYVVGIGPGGLEHLTFKAREVLQQCQVVVGYTFYIELIRDLIEDKTIISTGMMGEIERCKQAIENTRKGFDTCIISTGDSGLYGMAGPILELANNIEVEVIPGLTAAFCAAAEVGAPIMHDCCTISLSDLLTPWEVIAKRLEHAAQADFVIALYNPKSKGRPHQIEQAVEIMRRHKPAHIPVAIVKNAGRAGNENSLATLATLDYESIDMKTVVIVGNSQTYVKNGRMITPRGYQIEGATS
jgi:precorrin-3B C17-methyltransferase